MVFCFPVACGDTDCPVESASAVTLCLLLLMETNLCWGGSKSELETDVI